MTDSEVEDAVLAVLLYEPDPKVEVPRSQPRKPTTVHKRLCSDGYDATLTQVYNAWGALREKGLIG